MKNLIFLLLFSLAINCSPVYAQLHCGSVELILENQGNSLFTFDNFSAYDGGVPRTTIARLKVRVEDKPVSDGLCSWSLYLNADNNSAPATEWEELSLYSNGLGQNPLLNILELRVTNDCATSSLDGAFIALSDVSDIIEIIKPMILDIKAAGSCVENVNGPGDYISNYQEFTFKIEVRIKPGMNFNPGRFALTLNFRLEENI